MLWNVNPWKELERMRREMNSLFEDGFRTGGVSHPPVNVYDNGEEVMVQAEIPGMVKDDVSVTFTDGQLTLKGHKKPLADSDKYAIVRSERASGDFEKTLKVPYPVLQDKITAEFKNGMLSVVLPKAEEAKPKKIEVNVN